jgi:hypothetical protein
MIARYAEQQICNLEYAINIDPKKGERFRIKIISQFQNNFPRTNQISPIPNCRFHDILGKFSRILETFDKTTRHFLPKNKGPRFW